MKKIFFVILIEIVIYNMIFGQSCEQCKKRLVILYDNEVTIPRPTGNYPDSVYNYWNYFFLAGGVRGYLGNIDATKDCIKRLDGAFFVSPDTVTSSIQFGVEHANTPPAGNLGWHAEYIVYGTVSGDAIKTLTLNLETAESRELVKSVSVELTPGFDPLVTGQNAATQLGPLYTTIMDF